MTVVHQPRPQRHVTRGGNRFTLIPNDAHTAEVLKRRRQLAIGEDYRVGDDETSSTVSN